MNRPDVLIVDGAPPPHCDPERAKPARDWPPVLIKRADIDREIERLADLPRPANGRRTALFVHPNAPDPGRGLTPGVQVALEVLKPGEQTVPIRHNSTQVNFCIRGRGTTRGRRPHDRVPAVRRMEPSVVRNVPARQRFERAARASDVFERRAARDDARAPDRGRPSTGSSEGACRTGRSRCICRRSRSATTAPR